MPMAYYVDREIHQRQVLLSRPSPSCPSCFGQGPHDVILEFRLPNSERSSKRGGYGLWLADFTPPLRPRTLCKSMQGRNHRSTWRYSRVVQLLGHGVVFRNEKTEVSGWSERLLKSSRRKLLKQAPLGVRYKYFLNDLRWRLKGAL